MMVKEMPFLLKKKREDKGENKSNHVYIHGEGNRIVEQRTI